MGIIQETGGGYLIPTHMSRRQMRFLVAVLLVLVFGALLTALNVYELHRLTQEHWTTAHSEGE